MGFYLTFQPTESVDEIQIPLVQLRAQVAFPNPHRGPIHNRVLSAKYTDDETGLVMYQLRAYSPGLGRFISRDPIGEGGGVNLTAFCLNDSIDCFDQLGLDVNIVYRPFASSEHWLARWAWSKLGVHVAGHVYLQFTTNNMCKSEDPKGQEWAKLLSAHGLNTSLASHTFSFHPISVLRERQEAMNRNEEADAYPKSGTDLNEGTLTLGGGVMWDDEDPDRAPAESGHTSDGMKVVRRLVTNKRDEQIAIYNRVHESVLHESTDYSVELKNCGDWAYRMVNLAGVRVPFGSRFSNGGTGSGGVLDWLGVSRAAYAGAVGYYGAKQATKWGWAHRDFSVDPRYGRSGVPEDYMGQVGIRVTFGGRP